MGYQLPYFGTLDPEELGEYYDVEVELNGQKLTLDINFDEESIATGKLDLLKRHLENIPAVLEQAKKVVRDSFEKGGDAREYIDKHIDDLRAPELEEELKGVDASLPDEEKLFSLVHPVRIGLYPEDEESYFTLDFSISRDVTQYLIVVVIDVNEKLKYITTES